MSATATSQTKIINIALALLGEPEIADIDDEGYPAQLARTMYAATRDAVLEEFTWNFATTSTSISKIADTPQYEFESAYPVPENYLRVYSINGDREMDWRVEMVNNQLCIVTSLDSPIALRFIYRQLDVTQYTATFIAALAARLAAEWATPLSKDKSLAEQLAQSYIRKISLARSTDSSEKTGEVIYSGAWVDARRSGGGARLAKLPGPPGPLGY